MKNLIVLTLLAVATICQGQVDDNFFKGSIALSNKKFKEAINYFDKVIESNPDDEKALLFRSKANYSLKHYELAINDCERVLQINDTVTTEDDYNALWNLGVSYNSLRNFEKARYYLNEALKLEPTDIGLYENIGYSYLEENKYDQALDQFLKLVSINDKSEKGFYGIGKVYYLKGEYENSIEAFDKAIDINPNYGIAYQNRGSAKLEINDEEGCCYDWKRCFELGVTQIKPFLDEFCK